MPGRGRFSVRVVGPLFFFQAEDGIRDRDVTGVQTCALPILGGVRRDMDRNPRTSGVRSQNAVVEEACCPISGEVELDKQQRLPDEIQFLGIDVRSEERRVGKECRCQWWRQEWNKNRRTEGQG